MRTDEGAEKPHRNLTAFLVEKPVGFGEVVPGLLIPGKIDKLGYKGIETTELIFDGYQASADDVLGGTTGQGFFQMMDGIEVGRVNVSARACGVGIRAFELAVRYAQQRANLRQADRRTSGHRVPAGRDGDQSRSGTPDDGQRGAV